MAAPQGTRLRSGRGCRQNQQFAADRTPFYETSCFNLDNVFARGTVLCGATYGAIDKSDLSLKGFNFSAANLAEGSQRIFVAQGN